jgi:hypothetical protein
MGEAIMSDALSKRVDLGRSVRARALCMMEAHGPEAERAARAAAREPGVSAADRNFWELVADRVARNRLGDAATIASALDGRGETARR